MKKRLFIIIALVSIMFASCKNYMQDKAISPFRLIPESSSLILETNNFLSLWGTYSKSNIWGLKKENPGLNHVHVNLTALNELASQNETIRQSLSEKKVLLSALDIDGKTQLLGVFQADITSGELKKIIRLNFNERATFSEIAIADSPAFKLIFSNQNDILFVAFREGNVIASYSKAALRKSIGQYHQSKDLTDDPSFRNIRQTSGEYTDASLYINFNKLPALLAAPEKLSGNDLLQGLSGLARWGALDITAKKNRLLMNGFINTDTNSYLSVFKEKPTFSDLKNILPRESAVVMTQKFSAPEHLRRGIRKKITAAGNSEDKSYFSEQLYPYIKNNIILAISSDGNGTPDNNTFIYLQATAPKKAFEGLKAIANKMDGEYYNKKYQGYDLIQVPSHDLFSKMLGSSFQNISSPYFAVYNDYLVGCSDKNHLTRLLHQLEDGKSIAQNDIYQSTSSGITSESNLALFIDINRALDLLPSGHPLKNSAGTNDSFFKSLNGLSVEFTAADKLYFASVFLNTGEKLRMSSENNWDLNLEAKMIGKPHIVNDHLSSEKRIIVFDALNNMYFINHKGEILWQHMLSGRPLSDVYEVDAYKNNKVQYLFNTENHIYLLDVLGRDVSNFPVELNSPATNGLALFDYTGNKYYRIMVAGSDKKVYNFDIEGKQVQGWNKPSMKGNITKPVQRLVYGNRDYIIIADNGGGVKITNRRGEERIEVTDEFTNGTQSKFYLNRTNDKAPFITTDNRGTLTYLNADGSASETSFDTFSPQHHFFYERFDDNPHYDFIYFDNKKLTVFDRFKKVVFEHDFGDQVLTRPEVTTFNDKRAIIFTSLSDDRLYLVTIEGVNPEINRFEGTTLFDMGKLKRFGKTSIVTGNEEKLFKYIID